MTKQLLAVAVVAVFAGTLFGFTLAGASSPPTADAAASSQIVRQLKRLNSKVSATNAKLDALSATNAKLDTLNTRIGDTQTTQGTVRGLLTIICDYTASIDCKR